MYLLMMRLKTFKPKISLCTVYSPIVSSAKSKVALHTHESTKNAQAVYKELLQAYSDGTTAALTAENLENQLCAMKLDNSWNKPLETFLHLWSTRLHDLKTIRDDSVSDSDKHRWFINSVKSHANLYQGINTAKSVEQTLKGMSGCHQITWEQFFNLVLDQAQIIDSQNPQSSRRQQRSNNATRSVNNTNTQQRCNNNGNRNN